MRQKALNRRLAGAILGTGLVILVVLTLAIVTGAFSSESGPTELRTGELDEEAVETVTSFNEFPVLWLGTEFEGYPLTSAILYNNPPPPQVPGARPEHRLVMVYGSCDRGRQTSCAPPLAIHIWAPFSSAGRPLPPGVVPEDEHQRRDLPVSFEEERLTLYTSSITIDVQGERDIAERAIVALRTANAQILGVPDIGPTESLLPLITQ